VVNGGGAVKWRRRFPGMQRRGVALLSVLAADASVGREYGPKYLRPDLPSCCSSCARLMGQANERGFISNSHGWLAYYLYYLVDLISAIIRIRLC